MKRLKKTRLLIAAALFAAGMIGIAGYYIFRDLPQVMTAARDGFAHVWRTALGAATAWIPFSVYEAGVTLLALCALLWLCKTIYLAVRRSFRRAVFRRLIPAAVAGIWVWALFLWTWCAGYYAVPFYDGVLTGGGVTAAQLEGAARYFLAGANEYAERVPRTGDGSVVLGSLRDAARVYSNLSEELRLPDSPAAPKPMLYSKLMSSLQFTGVYMAITGEANVNVDCPAALIPCTAAHELAHARGVAREGEADFFGILACITADESLLEYRYSGYLTGLIKLGNALYRANPGRYYALAAEYSELVLADLRREGEYWARYQQTAASAAVMSAYDSYLKSNGQEDGARSYEQSADLLAEWWSVTHGNAGAPN
jgi:hypothetical protein